jgi:hypothetical protein
MKAIKLLHKALIKACPDMHKVRLKALMAGVTSAAIEQRVSVTQLGRNLKKYSKTKTKHDIKRMDRLTGNNHLHQERLAIYQYMTSQLIGLQKHPLLLVDWSPVPENNKLQILRISIPMGGRSLTILEECYPDSQLNTPWVHDLLLEDLSQILPDNCQPIISSDAIFKTPWFESIERRDWYWVGRVRGNVSLSLNHHDWESTNQIMKQATSTPKALGEVLYGKSVQFSCQAYLYHGKIKGTHKKKKRGGISQDRNSLYYSQKAKEPWLLIARLPDNITNPKKVVSIYKNRMQIEEGFRDTKSTHYGLALDCSRTKKAKRFDNLLLLASLALYVLWCVGKAAERSNYHYDLQANTTKHRTVLSYIFVGRQVINDKRYKIKKNTLKKIMNGISKFTIPFLEQQEMTGAA